MFKACSKLAIKTLESSAQQILHSTSSINQQLKITSQRRQQSRSNVFNSLISDGNKISYILKQICS